jgi:hydrogenase expression/formation protein HypC
MCLAIPAKVVELNENGIGQVETGGMRRQANLRLVPGVKLGEYVLLHAGYAISTVSEQDAMETLSLLEQMAEIACADEAERGVL